jgi:hypothetical protein
MDLDWDKWRWYQGCDWSRSSWSLFVGRILDDSEEGKRDGATPPYG